LVDTAGIDTSETLGIPGQAQTMTSEQIHQANCTVWCVDTATPSYEAEIARFVNREAELMVITKSDLQLEDRSFSQATYCSSRTGEGLDALANGIAAFISHEATASAVASTATRCVESLTHAQESLATALELVHTGGGDELIAVEIRTTLEELGRVVGAVYTDNILDRIFSTFCIGK
jgi:tRNA modification GTPase